MIVSWNWLKEYVDLSMTHDELVDRLTMSGLNHDGTEPVAGDQAIDLEVTSNRPDCLGHLGIAREIAVLFDQEVKLPAAEIKPVATPISDVCRVTIEAPQTCYRYTARVIRGVKIGPSPQWLQDRLTTIGIGVVNNVVDVTNYVMMECGQPLHAFDFGKISGGQIIVRNAAAEESFEAIDHKTYSLTAGMCVIADRDRAVALGGVMGGADSEVSAATTDILLEAAYFDQLAVRNAARTLKLFSPSSFRFERNIDSANLDWASRRACELIVSIAGGEVLDGWIDVGQPPATPVAIPLRLSQLKRLLGIEIPAEFAERTLTRLGLTIESADSKTIVAVPPSWRNDLTREVDLIEEVGRIYGFDQIPDDVNVPMAASHRPLGDRMLDRVRQTMVACGYDEAVTASLVPEPWSAAFSPWCDQPPMVSSQPMLGVLEEYSKNIGAVNLLRRSLVPSLLEARRINEYRSSPDASLFETACVYLSRSDQAIPDQPLKLAMVTGGDYYEVKGVVEMILESLHINNPCTVVPCRWELLDATRSGELQLQGQTLGWLGEVSRSAAKTFGLRSRATVAEIDLGILQQRMVPVPQHRSLSSFPPVSRDFNLIVDNRVAWDALEATVRSAAGPLLEDVRYRETFRDEQKDGADRKRILLSVILRSDSSTLTGDQAEGVCKAILDACQHQHQASLVS